MEKQYNVIERITDLYKTLSKGQKKIADYILKNYDKGAYITAGKLSELTGVSCSTVVRFATELGYDGYFELQTAMQEMMRAKLTSVQRMEIIASRLGNDDILAKTLHSDINKIKKTLCDIDHKVFAAVIDALITVKKIYIIGTRSAAYLAGFLYYNLNIIFDNVHFVMPSSTSEACEQMLRIDENSILIAVSFPRYSHITLKSMQYAKSKGAQIAAITDSYTSPLHKYSDYTLIAHSDIASFADSLVAPLSVINALIAAVCMIKKDDVYKALRQLEEIWDQHAVYKHTNGE